MTLVKDITSFLLTKYPLSLGCDYDSGKIGLEVGSNNAEVKKIMIALDGTVDVVNEAVKNHVDLLITHHPMVWNPQLSFNYDAPMGSKLQHIFANKMNLFAMHTNFDNATGGMNEYLLSKLGVSNLRAEEEIISPNTTMRLGEIKPMTLKELALKVKETFGESGVRVVGDLNKKITTIGMIAGGGGAHVLGAKRSGADCYISGEFHHNNAIDAIENGIGLIEVSHYVEHLFKSYVKEMLEEEFKDVEILLANESCPFTIL